MKRKMAGWVGLLGVCLAGFALAQDEPLEIPQPRALQAWLKVWNASHDEFAVKLAEALAADEKLSWDERFEALRAFLEVQVEHGRKPGMIWMESDALREKLMRATELALTPALEQAERTVETLRGMREDVAEPGAAVVRAETEFNPLGRQGK